jgi:hypothetical protein
MGLFGDAVLTMIHLGDGFLTTSGQDDKGHLCTF